MIATSQFSIIDWNEEFIYNEEFARATANYQITGEMVGTLHAEYSIFYLFYDKENIHNSTSKFSGFTKFTGKIDGKVGSFILEDMGGFINNEYKTCVNIIENSGTGDFRGISGQGSYVPLSDKMILNLELDY